MKILAGAALLWAAALAAYVVDSGVLLVDVREADGPRLIVPVPLAAARAGLLLAPEKARRIRAPEAAGAYLPYAERAVDALREAPDGVLLEVIDGDAHVTVTREGRGLRVRAIEGDRTEIEALVPLKSLKTLLRGYDPESGSFRTSKLIAALGEAPRGDWLRVEEGGDRVRIRRLL